MEGKVSATPARSMLQRFLGRVSSAERVAAAAAAASEVASSVCLDGLVKSYMEDGNPEPPPPPRPARRYCNCFNGRGAGAGDESTDDEWDFFEKSSSAAASAQDAVEAIKKLAPCWSAVERNLLADVAKIVAAEEKNKTDKKKIADGLRTMNYNAGVCVSRWEKTSSIQAGTHEYIDVVIVAGDGGGERRRLIVEVDFKSEFEVARPTKAFRAALQALPSVFVGEAGRLSQIVGVAGEAARQSLKKKGLHVPPWRKTEYMRAKWLSPHERSGEAPPPAVSISAAGFYGEFELRFGSAGEEAAKEGERIGIVVVSPIRPPEMEMKRKLVAGLSSVL